MMTREQCRAARGWLAWSQEDLAKHARVSLSTVKDFENGRRMPMFQNLDAIKRAFETEGIVPFFEGEEPAGIKKVANSDQRKVA